MYHKETPSVTSSNKTLGQASFAVNKTHRNIENLINYQSINLRIISFSDAEEDPVSPDEGNSTFIYTRT